MKKSELKLISLEQFEQLLHKLQSIGYQLIGPTIKEQAITYDKITEIKDLPSGWTDEHGKGSYKLVKKNDNSLFAYNLGPDPWKKFLYPSKQTLFTADRLGNDIKVKVQHKDEQKLAFIGVRSCELHAIKIQDKVFLGGSHVDLNYTKRRKNTLIIAVNCSTAGASCFCTTMNTGPKVDADFDLALTEIVKNEQHDFLLEIGSELGGKIIQGLDFIEAKQQEIEDANNIVNKVANILKKRFDNSKVKELLANNLENPIWDELDKRCLSCANCTLVCPTCFCSNVEDHTNLTGTETERRRTWDSCFNPNFTYMHGGPVRDTIRSRYRHWITHKLSNWHVQFGTSGCVGCGRCITWCPVGIDITEEVKKLENEQDKKREN